MLLKDNVFRPIFNYYTTPTNFSKAIADFKPDF